MVGQLGVELNLIPHENNTALVAAGLVSVAVFPLAALMILRSGRDG